ncbi:MAG: hypothetical protein FJ212_04970 [Ignavibacteria bacterium]|nr:hypothetical protein [Ignavibacteria bacterium]MBM4173688.1 hypothetical protein [Ignavibacteria bacterium]
MRNIWFILLVFLAVEASAQKPKNKKKTVAQKELPKRYTLRSGELLMFSEMDGMRTKITVSFDNHGAREVTESVGYRAVEQDLNLKVHSKSIFANGVLTTIDVQEGKGTRYPVGQFADAGGINFAMISDSVKKEIGLEMTNKTDTVLGYVCDVWTIAHPVIPFSGTYSVWGNLVLKSETITNGIPMKTYAVKIEANKPFDESLLVIPEDIIFKEPGK